MKIYWTNFAKQELQSIFNYYKENASARVAKNLVTGIVKESQKLSSQPLIGQEEELLDDLKLEYRYLTRCAV